MNVKAFVMQKESNTAMFQVMLLKKKKDAKEEKEDESFKTCHVLLWTPQIAIRTDAPERFIATTQ
jgi:hypothetical protein